MSDDSTLRPSPLQHLTALFSLLGIAWLCFMGDPVFKRVDTELLTSDKAYSKVERKWGAPIAWLAYGAAWYRKNLRRPVVDSLQWTVDPLRISQGYGVYPDGGRSVKVMDIRLDGKLVHRSGSDVLTWLEPELRFRKLRPLVFKMMNDRKKRRFQPGISRYIAAMAQRENAQEVDIIVHEGPYPGTEMAPKEWGHLGAPRWKLRSNELDGLPEDWRYEP